MQPFGLASSDGLAATHGVIDLHRLRQRQYDLPFARHKAMLARPGELAHDTSVAFAVRQEVIVHRQCLTIRLAFVVRRHWASSGSLRFSRLIELTRLANAR